MSEPDDDVLRLRGLVVLALLATVATPIAYPDALSIAVEWDLGIYATRAAIALALWAVPLGVALATPGRPSSAAFLSLLVFLGPWIAVGFLAHATRFRVGEGAAAAIPCAGPIRDGWLAEAGTAVLLAAASVVAARFATSRMSRALAVVDAIVLAGLIAAAALALWR